METYGDHMFILESSYETFKNEEWVKQLWNMTMVPDTMFQDSNYLTTFKLASVYQYIWLFFIRLHIYASASHRIIIHHSIDSPFWG